MCRRSAADLLPFVSPSLPTPPPEGGDRTPNGFHHPKRPCALEKTIDRSEGTRPGKGENEPVATILKGVAHQHRRHGKQPKGSEPVHSLLHPLNSIGAVASKSPGPADLCRRFDFAGAGPAGPPRRPWPSVSLSEREKLDNTKYWGTRGLDPSATALTANVTIRPLLQLNPGEFTPSHWIVAKVIREIASVAVFSSDRAHDFTG